MVVIAFVTLLIINGQYSVKIWEICNMLSSFGPWWNEVSSNVATNREWTGGCIGICSSSIQVITQQMVNYKNFIFNYSCTNCLSTSVEKTTPSTSAACWGTPTVDSQCLTNAFKHRAVHHGVEKHKPEQLSLWGFYCQHTNYHHCHLHTNEAPLVVGGHSHSEKHLPVNLRTIPQWCISIDTMNELALFVYVCVKWFLHIARLCIFLVVYFARRACVKTCLVLGRLTAALGETWQSDSPDAVKWNQILPSVTSVQTALTRRYSANYHSAQGCHTSGNKYIGLTQVSTRATLLPLQRYMSNLFFHGMPFKTDPRMLNL